MVMPALLLGPLGGAGLQLPSEVEEGIDQVFSDYRGEDGPGCALGIVRDGSLVFARGYGLGSLDHGIPLRPSSVFYLASVSKQFTAAAILMAGHEGYLKLDDPVQAHIQEFPDYGYPLTIRHLLHHTSGIRDYLTLMALAGIPYENVLADEAMLGLITRQQELNFEPGTEFLYSNSGYVLLAEIVKRATGRPLSDYAQEKIFGPLGMENTHFHDDRTRVVPGRVFSYDRGAGGSWRTNYLMNFDKVGDGGLYSSVEDLARWDRAFYEDLLGIPDFAEKMYERGHLNTGATIPYARGLNVGSRRGLPRVSHGGGLMAFRTMIARYPEQGTSVITLCNVGTANSSRLSAAVEDILLESAFPEPPPPREARREAAEETEEATEVSEEFLQELAGSYWSQELDSEWVFRAQESALLLHHPSGESSVLRAVSGTEFATGGLRVRFSKEGGDVVGFSLDAGRVRNIRFERMKDP